MAGEEHIETVILTRDELHRVVWAEPMTKVTEEEVARRRRGQFVHTPSYAFEATGEISIKVDRRAAGLQSTWKDTRSEPVEGRLNELILGLRALAAQRKVDRSKQEDRGRRFEAMQQERGELSARIVAEEQALKNRR